MRQIPKKNYYILALILVLTVLVTLALCKLYINLTRDVNPFYEYSNTIDANEFDEYVLEKDSYFIYISDKYDLTLNEFEEELQDKIIEYTLHDNYIYIDKSVLNKKLENKINDMGEEKINFKRLPIILEVEQNKIINIIYVDINAYDIDTLLNYEELK